MEGARYRCRECDSRIYLRCRADEPAYVRLGCDCGAVELGLRIARTVDGDLERDGIGQWIDIQPEVRDIRGDHR